MTMSEKLGTTIFVTAMLGLTVLIAASNMIVG
jgi:hypothetical protein